MTFVDSFTAVTFAPETGAPDWSTTVPTRAVLLATWASKAEPARRTPTTVTGLIHDKNRCFMLSIPSVRLNEMVEPRKPMLRYAIALVLTSGYRKNQGGDTPQLVS